MSQSSQVAEATNLEFQVEPVHLGEPPEVLKWWAILTWGAFIVGTGIALVALSAMVFHAQAARDALARVLYVSTSVAFVLGAANTVCAGLGFSSRSRRIRRWVSERRTRMHPPRDGGSCARDATGDEWQLNLQVEGSGRVYVHARRAARAGDDRESNGYVQHGLGEYLRCLENEVSGPRESCARMAAALGGLFLVSMEILVSLARVST